ncbi:MAG TPA: TonB-dependent receptor [Vicinamibacterales bacterium]|nr:TonB-dependent receptor [Vicinamibacterales bacterium]
MITLLLIAILFQSPALTGVVVDSTSAPVRGAMVTVTVNDMAVTVETAQDGTWTAALPASASGATVRVTATGFSPVERTVKVPSPALRTELRLEAIAEQITVSAESWPARLSIESSVTTIDRSTIAAAPALRLDDQLRMVPGFSLFRRTSSAVANPTTQGVTLRGLSASGASRTLVVSDDVPLNDPFGGWVYWDRIPVAALQRVDILRGGSGDVHGNDALGGVIRLTTRTSSGAEAWIDGGSRGSQRISGYAAISRDGLIAGGSGERLATDGYRVVAPEARGVIDVPADSHATSGLGWIGATHGALQGTARGGYFTEDRGNGTPAQVNGTVTRWGGGNAHGLAGGGVWEARGDVSATSYRQTFSAVATSRATERLTNLQWVGSTGGGVGVSWILQRRNVEGLIAFNDRIARANLDEASIAISGVQSAIARTRARQHGEGVMGQIRFMPSTRLTLDAGARADYWRLTKLASPDIATNKGFFEPRVGATVSFASGMTLRGTWMSGFRTPTMNELYRSFRVGNTTTQANASLKAEESHGPEVAFTMRRDRWTARAIAYATWLDGAVYNRTLSASSSAIVRERTNGDARTIGSELELEWRAHRGITVTSAWAINDATFTSGELDGKRVPQVPRASGSIGARANAGAFAGAATLRIIGAQFDDDRNELGLARGSLLDGRAGWRWSRRVELFAALENALDEELDTGRTPIRTVGAPRLWRAGLTLKY